MNKTILVIDDDRKFLRIIEDALKPRGYNVITAPSGDRGISIFQKEKPDLLLLDALLPKMDGFAVCEEIRKDSYGRTVPIIMMTAVYKMPNKEQEARSKYQVKEYLNKPIDL